MDTDSVTAGRARSKARFGSVTGHFGQIVLARDAPLIPQGEYDAIGTGHSRFLRVFNTNKLTVEFAVLLPDVNAEFGMRRVPLLRYYNIALAPGGRFKVGPHSDYARE